jgi:acetyl-CoA carboxylase biotin carboxyl carrier protein
MDIEKIKQLVELVKQSEIDELEVTEGKGSVRIRCNTPLQPPAVMAVNSAPLPHPVDVPAITTPPIPSSHQVRSPMVGLFYRSPSPGEKPFVAVGQTVKVGDALCIVEAMKMMNKIEADQAGVITAIFIEDGQPIEFDEPLMAIEPVREA